MFFILFRLPMLFYLLTQRSYGESVIFSLEYSIYLAIGLINNVLIFVTMMMFNKIYRKLFFEYIRFKKPLEDAAATTDIVLKSFKKIVY
jgi:hypothetical protein